MSSWYEREYVDALAQQAPEVYAPDYRRRSAAVVESTPGRLDVAYGSHARQRLDVFFPEQSGPVPLILFFHGGYWRSNSRESRRFLAAHWVGAGVAFAVADYRIAPHGRIGDMVDDACAAYALLRREAEAWGIEREAIIVTGNSAGAHLAAMVASVTSPKDAPRGTCLLSGLFDLRPLLETSVATELCLSREEAVACSPLLVEPGAVPAALFVGCEESPAFLAQSEAYCWQRRAMGLPASCTALPGHNHFSIIAELGRVEGPVGEAVVQLLEPGDA